MSSSPTTDPSGPFVSSPNSFIQQGLMMIQKEEAEKLYEKISTDSNEIITLIKDQEDANTQAQQDTQSKVVEIGTTITEQVDSVKETVGKASETLFITSVSLLGIILILTSLMAFFQRRRYKSLQKRLDEVNEYARRQKDAEEKTVQMLDNLAIEGKNCQGEIRAIKNRIGEQGEIIATIQELLRKPAPPATIASPEPVDPHIQAKEDIQRIIILLNGKLRNGIERESLFIRLLRVNLTDEPAIKGLSNYYLTSGISDREIRIKGGGSDSTPYIGYQSMKDRLYIMPNLPIPPIEARIDQVFSGYERGQITRIDSPAIFVRDGENWLLSEQGKVTAGA